MSIPTNTPNVFDPYNSFANFFHPTDLFEKRMENNANGDPIYIGYTIYPNGDINEPIWFIVKVIYSGENIVRYQLPDGGTKFAYKWASRATYFL